MTIIIEQRDINNHESNKHKKSEPASVCFVLNMSQLERCFIDRTITPANEERKRRYK